MSVLTKFHRKRELIQTIDMTAQGRTVHEEIRTNKVYSAFEMVVTATFSGAANVPAEGGAPSILNLIEEVHIRRNGNKKHFAASGKQLYYSHYRDTGVAPFAVPAIGQSGTADETLTATVDWRFDAKNVLPYYYNDTFGNVGSEQFALDLRDETNMGYLNKTVEIGVTWAEQGSVIGTAVDSAITSAKIEFYGIEKVYPVGVDVTMRHWETEVRREVVSATGSPTVKHDLPRIANQALMDVMVVVEEGRDSVAFAPDGKVTVRHDDYHSFDQYPVRLMRSNSWELRRAAIPDNLLLFNFLPDHDLKAGILNTELRDQPLTIEIPQPEGSGAAAVKDITVFTRFAKVPQVA